MRRRSFIPISFAPHRGLVRLSSQHAPAGVGRRMAIAAIVAVTLLVPLPAARAVFSAMQPSTLPTPGSIQLTPNLPSPQPVGTTVTWTAVATDSVPLVYRFSVAAANFGPFRVVRDYSTRNTFNFTWGPLQEGTFYVQVTVKEGYTATVTASTTASFTFTPRATATTAAVSPTANPLVALYSAPACPKGLVKVAFQASGSTTWTDTNAQTCQAGFSRNFLVAGMLPSTTYQMVHVFINGSSVVTSTPLSFTTGSIPSYVTFPTISVPQAPMSNTDTAEGLVFHALVNSSTISEANPLATNLAGQVMWYANVQDLTSIWPVRIQSVPYQMGNVVYILGSDGQAAMGDNVLRQIDLAGDSLRETNIEAINAQLAARGVEQIYGFHHDAELLPNGDTAVMAFTEQTITTTPIMGDMVIVLDKDLQVTWTWDAFQTMDPYRGPTLGDTCVGLPSAQCPVPGYPNVIDWTHGNAIDYSPADQNIIVSLRNQDWVIKVLYRNGTGDSSVLWRMGPGGNFSLVPLNPSDPYPWFSHQHDSNYLDPTTITLFDDGNTRCAHQSPPCYSRGQTYQVNEQTMVVTQTVNASLGNYSMALGTAQRLTNGNYNFTSGFQTVPPPPFGQEIEVMPDGTKEYVQQVSGLEYRAWRLVTMDSPFNLPCTSTC